MTSSCVISIYKIEICMGNNFVQCVKPKHVSTKLEYTTIVDDYCAGGRVSDEYQGLCACASPSSSVC